MVFSASYRLFSPLPLLNPRFLCSTWLFCCQCVLCAVREFHIHIDPAYWGNQRAGALGKWCLEAMPQWHTGVCGISCTSTAKVPTGGIAIVYWILENLGVQHKDATYYALNAPIEEQNEISKLPRAGTMEELAQFFDPKNQATS